MPPHVNDSRWVTIGHRFAFISLFSGAISSLFSVAIAVYMELNKSGDILGYFLKLFSVLEIFFALVIFLSMAVASFGRSFRSKRNSFRGSWNDLFINVEQVWFYIPLTLALGIYLVIGGV